MKRLGFRPQRTLARSVSVSGVGLLFGDRVRVRFRPAAPDSGIIFLRTDLRQPLRLAARYAHVTGTHRRTTLGQPPHQITLVEHVLAALAGLRIDNCQVEINGEEPPGLDGSSGRFVQALLSVGIIAQQAQHAIWSVSEPLTVEQGDAKLTIAPAQNHELQISYLLDYGERRSIVRQKHSQTITPESFARELANCRTFLLEHEADILQRQGVGVHITPADLLVFGAHGPIDNELRFANEAARHKVLDIIGDLALLGRDLRGTITAQRSGHPLNIELVRKLGKMLPQTAFIPRYRAA
ncbi:MAG TPA: UDP-3-O-acyl-N-acetylglucosamine deacetylase [Gemmataceae bacterium]|nr:UDP-3-O-acyl-N-acetylglucosamine deacetylase [Gemmataceae bacterium]